MLTPEILMRVMNECLDSMATEWYVGDGRDMTTVDIGDGWIDLVKAAELLNAELLRQAQSSESVGMLNINVTAWEET